MIFLSKINSVLTHCYINHIPAQIENENSKIEWSSLWMHVGSKEH